MFPGYCDILVFLSIFPESMKDWRAWGCLSMLAIGVLYHMLPVYHIVGHGFVLRLNVVLFYKMSVTCSTPTSDNTYHLPDTLVSL